MEPPPQGSPDLAELDRLMLEAAVQERGQERFRARQIFGWIYRRGVTEIQSMTDLPRALRDALTTDFKLTTPQIAARERSADGTEKFLLTLADGRQIESVFIPDTPAMTFCISTQVGCAMACAFCLTGKMGLVRHLAAGEIAGQVRVLARALAADPAARPSRRFPRRLDVAPDLEFMRPPAPRSFTRDRHRRHA